ncbi:MAG TPA: hypothetical protein VL137_00980 [Polyangiaceae bacterium]|nr:hypothetical protein [Polyangiaceae bacterium]
MSSGFVRAAMWVAVFVVPGGVLLLPALIWRRGAAASPQAAVQQPAVQPESTNTSAA